jgi:hypothetical protein
MKIVYTLLVLVFSLSRLFCAGQTHDLPINENGLIFSYDGAEKTGTRYDEYCKTTFDIYTVKGTVVNNNTDKAAQVHAILNFYGWGCNKIYSDNGPTGGEVIKKLYTLDIAAQTKHKSQYWVNRFVQLLPGEQMEAEGNVEVKQGEPCPYPEHLFTYEVIPGQGSAPASSNAEATTTVNTTTTGTPAGGSTNYASLILGKWARTHFKTANGEDQDKMSSSFAAEYKANGEMIFWINGKSDLGYHWSISENILTIKLSVGRSTKLEILALDNTTLVIKSNGGADGKQYAIQTFKRVQ